MLSLTDKKELIECLFKNNIVSFSTDKNLSTFSAPYDINLRLLSSFPNVLKFVAHIFGKELNSDNFDLMAGPFTDIPLATTISLEFNWPMIFVREERKDHGTERLVEGNYHRGQKVIAIDDEIDDVAGTLQLLGRLEGSGLKVAGIDVLLDRGYGALEEIKKKGYDCRAMISLNEIFIELAQNGNISSEQLSTLRSYLEKQRKEFLLKLNSGVKNTQ